MWLHTMNRQHSLFLCVVDSIVQLAKEFSKDPTRLLKLHIHWTTASYKLFVAAKDQFVVKLKNVLSSLNLDQATLTNLLCVFSVLVSYYDKQKHSLVVRQLASLSILVVDAENLFCIFAVQLTMGKFIADAHGLCLFGVGREEWTGDKSERSCS